MKLAGFVGKGTGKMGASVFVVRKGEQIVRQYQPIVDNPKSTAQVQQRAMMKLASQLSAVLSFHLEPMKMAAVKGQSARNVFVKSLFMDSAMSFAGDKASADLSKLKLTASVIDGMSVTSGGIIAGGLVLNITVRPFADFKQNSTLNAVVLRSSNEYGIEVIGYGKTDVSTSEPNTTIAVETSVNPTAGDVVMLYIARVEPSKLPTVYRNMYAGSSAAAMLDVIQREVPSALTYSKTLNLAVPTQS